MKRLIFYLVPLLFIQGCQTIPPKPSSGLPHDYNPMPETWASIRREINALEERHASPKEWREAAENHQVISTEAALQTAFVHAPADTRSEITKAFRQYGYAEHYGFECDFEALVFFTKDRAAKVFK